MQEGQNAMIKRETTDTIPLFRVAQQFNSLDAYNYKSKHFISYLYDDYE
jgi:hypothetical protein